jgi:hypothetical protein
MPSQEQPVITRTHFKQFYGQPDQYQAEYSIFPCYFSQGYYRTTPVSLRHEAKSALSMLIY